jgi:hypothetical protein
MLTGLLAVIVVACIIFFLFIFVKKIFLFIINSIVGIFALIGFNVVFHAGIEINLWSVLITAIGGVIGFVIVLGCHYLGWVF